MNLPSLIAQTLYHAGVRLEDEGGNSTLLDADDKTKAQIVELLLAHGRDIELTINTDQIAATGIVDAVKESAWSHADLMLTDAIDEELWIIQCADAADAWVDAAIDQMKERAA